MGNLFNYRSKAASWRYGHEYSTFPFVTVFRKKPSIRIWNNQLVRYAGYEKDNQIIGDSSEVAFTKICQSLGWQGKGSHFDVLPLVLQVDTKYLSLIPNLLRFFLETNLFE